MEEVLKQEFGNGKVDAVVSRSAATLGKSRREYEADVCYVLRVMMSHIRVKRKLVVDDKKNSSDGKLNEKIHPLWLQVFYKIFGDKADALVTPRKEKPPPITKGSRQCIFVNFRKTFSQTGDSTDSEDDERCCPSVHGTQTSNQADPSRAPCS